MQDEKKGMGLERSSQVISHSLLLFMIHSSPSIILISRIIHVFITNHKPPSQNRPKNQNIPGFQGHEPYLPQANPIPSSLISPKRQPLPTSPSPTFPSTQPPHPALPSPFPPHLCPLLLLPLRNSNRHPPVEKLNRIRVREARDTPGGMARVEDGIDDGLRVAL